MSSRHRRADLNGLELWVRFAANGASITDISGGLMQQQDVVLTDTGTGDYILTINPFKGPRGVVWGVATTQTISTFASLTAFTYTEDSLAVTIKVESDASTATDAIVNVHLYAE